MQLPALVFTLALGAAPAPATLPPRAGCHTIEHLDQMLARRRSLPRPFRALGQVRMERDAYGPAPHVLTSEHFAIKWGNEPGQFDDAEAEVLLEALEAAWDHEMETLAFTPPAGTDAFLFNVYMYRTGLAVPDLGYSTHAGIDDEGYPYMSLGTEYVDSTDPSLADLMRVTTAHELFHAVQMTLGAYDTTVNYEAYWYWEATADWMSTQVWPESPVSRDYTPYYLLAPHLGIESVRFPIEDPEGFEPIQLHHYGAAVLPIYLTEQVADASLIHASWMTAEPDDNPLRVLDRLLAQSDSGIDGAFADFAGRCAALDFAHPELYGEAIERVVAQFPDYDTRFADEVDGASTDGWVEAPDDRLPEAWGFNVIRLQAPEAGPQLFAFEADASGSEATPAAVHGRVVRELGDGVEYTELIGDGTTAAQTVSLTGDEEAVYLVVAAQPELTVPGETFAYRYRIGAPDDGKGDAGGGVDDGGCRVAGGHGASGTAVLTIAIFALTRRRRRSISSNY